MTDSLSIDRVNILMLNISTIRQTYPLAARLSAGIIAMGLPGTPHIKINDVARLIKAFIISYWNTILMST